MVKCIAIDMDGTLVNSELTIAKENSEAIKEAQKKGIEVVIATGRSYPEAEYVLKDAGIRCPMICINGAEIRSVEGEIIHKESIPRPRFIDIKDSLSQQNIYFEVYTDRGTYTSDYDKALTVMTDIFLSAGEQKDYAQLLEGAKARFEEGIVTLVDHYDQLLTERDLHFYKVLAFSFDEQKVSAAKNTLYKFSDLAVSSSGKENIEITTLGAQKGEALTDFINKRQIAMEQTMAIGDNYNDLSMLTKVGHAVAMGNAPEEIKKKCDVVTEDHNNHGVAKAIFDVINA
ncbi:Cof-type HAD-IIB family hydrolase [Desertibacillus haloalkaliphilus]|uniref:Cof-type HAD-IIB family hydrolase n=1 Tax=Desertibacillus haloalkaliphilus TaxID=1328930 RepID=UPI001C2672C3|nr:Cof-type HAD-IIB family hydrolase [Desertibacillus haloalkaliphilus]MBU8907993.1 Cof-type HAD-IIB family hydrolase [Desertibacillus haloalkaliphilus]